jgi:hypothetical protein
MSSSRTTEAANPTRVLSTPEILTWDDDMEEALDEMGAGGEYVIG